MSKPLILRFLLCFFFNAPWGNIYLKFKNRVTFFFIMVTIFSNVMYSLDGKSEFLVFIVTWNNEH